MKFLMTGLLVLSTGLAMAKPYLKYELDDSNAPYFLLMKPTVVDGDKRFAIGGWDYEGDPCEHVIENNKSKLKFYPLGYNIGDGGDERFVDGDKYVFVKIHANGTDISYRPGDRPRIPYSALGCVGEGKFTNYAKRIEDAETVTFKSPYFMFLGVKLNVTAVGDSICTKLMGKKSTRLEWTSADSSNGRRVVALNDTVGISLGVPDRGYRNIVTSIVCSK